MVHDRTSHNKYDIRGFSVFDIRSYTARDNLVSIIILFLSFCMTSMSIIYNIEKWFIDPTMGQVVALCSFIIVGAIGIITVLLVELLWFIPHMKLVKWYLTHILCVFPPYAFASGVMDMSKYKNLNIFKQSCLCILDILSVFIGTLYLQS